MPLREDLRTRLGWDLVFRLDPLSDADKLAALSAQAAERGMHLAPEIINWMLTHHERDIRKLAALIDALDRYSWPTAAPSPCPCCAPCSRTPTRQPNDLPVSPCSTWTTPCCRWTATINGPTTWRAPAAPAIREARRRNDELMERYNRELTAEQAAEFMLGLLAAHPPYELAAWHEAFMAEVIRPSITSAARALVDEHLQAGDLCAVVTATNGFVTAPIARAFGIPT